MVDRPWGAEVALACAAWMVVSPGSDRGEVRGRARRGPACRPACPTGRRVVTDCLGLVTLVAVGERHIGRPAGEVRVRLLIVLRSAHRRRCSSTSRPGAVVSGGGGAGTPARTFMATATARGVGLARPRLPADGLWSLAATTVLKASPPPERCVDGPREAALVLGRVASATLACCAAGRRPSRRRQPAASSSARRRARRRRLRLSSSASPSRPQRAHPGRGPAAFAPRGAAARHDRRRSPLNSRAGG